MARFVPPTISLTLRADAVGGDGQFTVVWLSGEHDAATKPAVSSLIARAAEIDNSDVVVDLSKVTFMDAAIVGSLVSARNKLATRGLSLDVRAPSPPAQLVLRLCGITGLAPAPHAVHSRSAAPALDTWVAVLAEPTAARVAVTQPQPAMARKLDRAGG